MARLKHPDPAKAPPAAYVRPPQSEWIGPYQIRVRWRKKGMPSISKVVESWPQAWDWYEAKEAEFTLRGTIANKREAERTTFAEALDLYLASGEVDRKRSADREKWRIDTLKGESWAASFLNTLSVVELQRWVDERHRGGWSPSTIGSFLATISKTFQHLQKRPGFEGLGNPARAVSRPKQRPGRKAHLTEAQEAELLAVIDGRKGLRSTYWLGPLVRLALATGMRQGELRELLWSDIRLSESWLQVRESKDTKGGTRIRDVPLTPDAVALLKALKRELPRRLDGRLFPPIDVQTASKAFARAAAAAGLPDLTFHDLRHVAVTRLAEVVSSPLELAEFSGHRDLQTLKRYHNPRAADLARKVAKRIEETAGK